MTKVSTVLPRWPADPRVREAFQGCLVGGAVGDALGAAVKFLPLDEIVKQFGQRGITEFVPTYGRIGSITDHTQMTLFTAEGMLRTFMRFNLKGVCHPPGVIAFAYLRWLHTQGQHHEFHKDCLDGWLLTNKELFANRAPELTCLSGLAGLDRLGEEALNNSKGCGGVMRVAPIGMFFASLSGSNSDRQQANQREAFELACKSAAITHGHPTGQLASGAFASMVMGLALVWPMDRVIASTKELLKERAASDEVLLAIEAACRLATERPNNRDAIVELGSGWVAEEALAIVLYCTLSAANFREGVELAVNHGGNSISTGSMTGQLLGAVHGLSSIPKSWREYVELRSLVGAVADDLASVNEWQLNEDNDEGEDEFYWNRYPGS